MTDKPIIVIAFSGGKTSAYMTKRLIDKYSNRFRFVVVFANTGKEREETLRFVHNCDLHFGFNTVWIEGVTNPQYRKGVTAKVVTFETAARNGEPFETSIQKHGISTVNAPMCTRELKTYTINAYLRSMGLRKCKRAIGIRIDEIDRINPHWKREGILYPCINIFPTRKEQINAFWEAQPFTLELEEYQGNCDCCYKKSIAKLIRIAREEPGRFIWWADMERKYSYYIPKSRKNQNNTPVHFFRSNLSAKDLLRLSALTDDEIKAELKVMTLEVYNGCNESCEAF